MKSMMTDVGEYIVGAYLKLQLGCDVVDYNVRIPGGGLEGLGELDVMGLSFRENTAFLCEVTTHLHGLQYRGGNRGSVEKVRQKHERQRGYAERYLDNFPIVRFQFWSPRVPVGYMTENLAEIGGLELVINGEYKRRVEELRVRAGGELHDTNNPFFRVLQILENLRQ